MSETADAERHLQCMFFIDVATDILLKNIILKTTKSNKTTRL